MSHLISSTKYQMSWTNLSNWHVFPQVAPAVPVASIRAHDLESCARLAEARRYPLVMIVTLREVAQPWPLLKVRWFTELKDGDFPLCKRLSEGKRQITVLGFDFLQILQCDGRSCSQAVFFCPWIWGHNFTAMAALRYTKTFIDVAEESSAARARNARSHSTPPMNPRLWSQRCSFQMHPKLTLW